MRPEAAPTANTEDIVAPLEAFLASLRVWLLETLATLLDLFPSSTGMFGPVSRAIAHELRAYLRDAEYDAKRALLCLALARFTPPAHKPLPHHPPPGYALRRWRQSDLRFLTHGIFNRRPHTLRLRIDRLRDMLERPQAWIARLLKRLRRGFDGARAMLAAPPTERAAPRPTRTPAPADTS